MTFRVVCRHSLAPASKSLGSKMSMSHVQGIMLLFRRAPRSVPQCSTYSMSFASRRFANHSISSARVVGGRAHARARSDAGRRGLGRGRAHLSVPSSPARTTATRGQAMREQPPRPAPRRTGNAPSRPQVNPGAAIPPVRVRSRGRERRRVSAIGSDLSLQNFLYHAVRYGTVYGIPYLIVH